MKNEIIRVYEDKNEVIYKRIGREERGLALYFSDGGLEFRDIRGVKAFIKSLAVWKQNNG